jgi:hypothetical protein
MKQIAKNVIVSRSVDLLLKKDSSFREEDTVNLVKGISEQTHFEDPKTGKVVDVKDMDIMEMVNRDLKSVGVSGWHRFHDSFESHFTNTSFAGGEDVEVALNEAFEKGQNDFGNIFGDNIRSVSVGDVFSVSEWGENGSSTGLRFFIVSNVGFDEFKRATGEFL